MDAIKLLRQDHAVVDELFEKFEDTSAAAYEARRLLADRIVHELTIHASLEEKYFYPAARSADPEARELVLESFEEHAIVERLVHEVKTMDAANERFGAKMKVLTELVRQHVNEEEHELFPKVKSALGRERLETLGTQMEQAKLRVQKIEAEMSEPARRPSRETRDSRDSFIH